MKGAVSSPSQRGNVLVDNRIRTPLYNHLLLLRMFEWVDLADGPGRVRNRLRTQHA